MKYARILSYVGSHLWAIDEAKLGELLGVLAFRASGKAFTKEEIRARIGDGRALGTAYTNGSVALIPIFGVIAHRIGEMDDSSGGTSTERIGAMLARIAEDPQVGTIVYDIHTPGGTVTGVPELAAQMFALRGKKRQVAMINGLAASAGYWLASQADEIVSLKSGSAGSIGVYTAHTALHRALDKEGVDVTLISAGKYKVEGNPFQPLSDEARAMLQARVDAAYGQFVADVARGRGVSMAAVKAGYGQGRTLEGPDALTAGLIDRIGTMDETLSRLSTPTASVGPRAGKRVFVNGVPDALKAGLSDRIGTMVASKIVTSTDGHADAMAPMRADVKVLVCDCSADCPCQNGGVCGENCPTCEPGCACVAPETEPATPTPMPTGADARAMRFFL